MNRTPFVMSALLLGSLLLSSCGSSQDAAPAPPPEEHKALQRTIQEPIDRARAVEDTLQKQQDSMRQEMDESGG